MALADIVLVATAIIIALELAQVADVPLVQIVVPVPIALIITVITIVLELALVVVAPLAQTATARMAVIMSIIGIIIAAEQVASIPLSWIIPALVLLLMLLL